MIDDSEHDHVADDLQGEESWKLADLSNVGNQPVCDPSDYSQT